MDKHKLPEPDDVDFIIGDVEPGSQDTQDTLRIIAEIKQSPEYRAKSAEADRILASLGIDDRRYGIRDARSLLDHWHQCITDLIEADRNKSARINGDCATHSDGIAGSTHGFSPEG